MEYTLVFVICVLLIERYLTNRSHAQEREELIRAVISRDATEYVTTKVPPIEEEEEIIDKEKFQPIEELSTDKFMESI